MNQDNIGWKSQLCNWPAVISIILLLSAVRVYLASTLELHFDEAYYWYWSENLQLSYYDHPPGVSWLIQLGTAIFGDTELGIRFPGVLLVLAMSLIFYDIVWRVYKRRDLALLAALLPQAMPAFSVGAVIMTPDAPLTFFWSVCIWALVRLQCSGNAYWWLVAGIAGGAALASKYTALFLAPVILLWLILVPENRRWLTSGMFWLAGVAALMTFSPVLIWNASNDWISFFKQGGRVSFANGYDWRFLPEMVGAQLGVISPVLAILIAIGIYAVFRRGWPNRSVTSLFVLACIVPLGFFIVMSLTVRIQANWPAVAWITGGLIVIDWLAEKEAEGQDARKPVLDGILLGLCFSIAIFGYAASFTGEFGKKDPLNQLAGYRQLADKLVEVAEENDATWLAVPKYSLAASLRFYLKDRLEVHQFGFQPRYVGFRKPDMDKLHNEPALIIARNRGPQPTHLLEAFSDTKPLENLWRLSGETQVEEYRVFSANGAAANIIRQFGQFDRP